MDQINDGNPHRIQFVLAIGLWFSLVLNVIGQEQNGLGFEIQQINTDAFGRNIVGDAANEPSIDLNPLDRDQIVIGWRQFDSVTSSFREAGVSHSADGGKTWSAIERLDQGFFRTDPVVRCSGSGVFYYYSLTIDSSEYRCDMFHSLDGGKTWSQPIPARGGDRQWFAIDRTGKESDGTIYASWSPFASCCSGFFTRSFDGVTYSIPVPLPTGLLVGSITVGPEGELYVAGLDVATLDQASVLRSDDASDSSVFLPTFPVQRVVDLQGTALPFQSPGSPNPGGFLGHYDIEVDHSNSPTAGNLYLLATVNPFDEDPADIMFSRSLDGGDSWEPPIRINNDEPKAGAYNWFGAMSVAPNGRIDAIWNDMRDDNQLARSSLYYSYSIDGGGSWSEDIRLTEDFDSLIGHPQQNKIGDYYDVVSSNSSVHIAFAATFNQEQDVYYLRVPAAELIPMGDVNCDGQVNLLDVNPFVDLLTANGYNFKADFDGNGSVDAGDINGFVTSLTGE